MNDMYQKEKIVDTLLHAVWRGVWVKDPGKTKGICPRPGVNNNFQNSFFNRIKGFLAELNYFDLIADRPNILRGGWFVPKLGSDPLEDSVYYSVTPSKDEAEALFRVFGNAFPDIPMYAIVPKASADPLNLSEDSYRYFLFCRETVLFEEVLPEKFFSFWKSREQPRQLPACVNIESPDNQELLVECKRLLLDSDASATALEALLFDRYIYDALIFPNRIKGRPTDLDFVKLKPDGKVLLIDVKDKFLSRERMLGVNEDHLSFFMDIDELLGTRSQYVVRLSKGKEDRSLVGWYYISLRDFCTAETRDGNPGMNGNQANDVKMLPFDKFKQWTPDADHKE